MVEIKQSTLLIAAFLISFSTSFIFLLWGWGEDSQLPAHVIFGVEFLKDERTLTFNEDIEQLMKEYNETRIVVFTGHGFPLPNYADKITYEMGEMEIPTGLYKRSSFYFTPIGFILNIFFWYGIVNFVLIIVLYKRKRHI